MSITVDYCKNTDEFNSAKKLFGEIFSAVDYADRFYALIDGRDDVDVIVGKYNGEPVSVVHVIRRGDVSYIYGAGVLSKYRLKGVFRVLITECVKMCMQKGDKLIFTVPQESFHYGIYKKFDIDKDVCKNVYELTHSTDFETVPASDMRVLYDLYVEKNKDMVILPFELFEFYINETDRTVEFITDKNGICGYMLSKDSKPYEIYCKRDGFFRVVGREIFALAVENGKKSEEIYEAVYLD